MPEICLQREADVSLARSLRNSPALNLPSHILDLVMMGCPLAVTSSLTGLAPGSTYHNPHHHEQSARVAAVNSQGHPRQPTG